jgi:hypothetical protein
MMNRTLANIPEEIVLYAILPLLQCYELDVFSVTSKQNRKRVEKVMYPLFKQRFDQCLLGYVPYLTIENVLEANRHLYYLIEDRGPDPCISGQILTEAYLGRKVTMKKISFIPELCDLTVLKFTGDREPMNRAGWQRNSSESLSFNKHHIFASIDRDIYECSKGIIPVGNGDRYPMYHMEWRARSKDDNPIHKITIRSEIRFCYPVYAGDPKYVNSEHRYDIRVPPYIYRGTLVVPGWIKSLYML